MFDLEKQIGEWRDGMMRDGILAADVLDELENHLRSEFGNLLSLGKDEAEAFEASKLRIGTGVELRTEFDKIQSPQRWPVIAGWCFFLTLLVWMMAYSSLAWARNTSFETERGAIAIAHFITLFEGQGAGIVMTACGVAFIYYHWRGRLTRMRAASLERRLWMFSVLSAAFVFAALVLGFNYHGRFIGHNALGQWRLTEYGVAEGGVLCRLIWLLSFVQLQRSGRLSPHSKGLLCVGAAIVINLNLVARLSVVNRLADDVRWGYGLLFILIAVEFMVVVIGVRAVRRNAVTAHITRRRYV